MEFKGEEVEIGDEIQLLHTGPGQRYVPKKVDGTWVEVEGFDNRGNVLTTFMGLRRHVDIDHIQDVRKNNN